MIIPVAAALGRLKIIGLGGLDPAKSGAASDNVDNNTRQVGARNVGDALLIQAEA